MIVENEKIKSQPKKSLKLIKLILVLENHYIFNTLAISFHASKKKRFYVINCLKPSKPKNKYQFL